MFRKTSHIDIVAEILEKKGRTVFRTGDNSLVSPFPADGEMPELFQMINEADGLVMFMTSPTCTFRESMLEDAMIATSVQNHLLYFGGYEVDHEKHQIWFRSGMYARKARYIDREHTATNIDLGTEAFKFMFSKFPDIFDRSDYIPIPFVSNGIE